MRSPLAIALLAGLASCAPAGRDAPVSSIGLALVAPKGLLDVDDVKLYVFDKSKVSCNESSISVAPTSVERVFELGLARCNDNKAWCGTATLERNAERVLTFYIEGRFRAAKGGFSGCTERAVDQDPLQIQLKAQPIVEGVVCGDLVVGYGETCDPGTSVVNEACDGAKCQTKEVVVSNGKAANQFFRGLPGRKQSLGIRFHGGKFFAAWSDEATGFNGGDAGNEITVRRMADDLVTETSPLVLAEEVRLPPETAGATQTGTAKRGSKDTNPTMVSIGSDLLFVFLADNRVFASVQRSNFSRPPSGDAEVSPGGTKSSPHAAASASGDVLIAWVESNAVKSALRKSDGSIGATRTLSSGGTVSGPRVAWVGGDYVVVWSNGDDIKLRRVGADGTEKGTEITVNAAKTAGKQEQPDVAGFDSGEFLVAWKDGAGDVGADIRVQRFDKAGSPVGAEIAEVLNDKKKDGDQSTPVVAAGKSPQGTRFYLVAWQGVDQISARFVRADGDGKFLVNHVNKTTSEFDVGVDARPRSNPAVAIGPNHCAVAWADEAEGDRAGDDDRVRARRLPMPDPPK